VPMSAVTGSMIAAVKGYRVAGKIGEWAIKTSIETTRPSTRIELTLIFFSLCQSVTVGR
jgi:hypothetical protein